MVVYSKPKRPAWQHLTPGRARALTDARLQLHHAAQFLACLGISYLPHAADDSHTSMEWIASGALGSRPVGPRPFRLAVRLHPMSLVVVAANAELGSFELNGRTIDDGTRWIRARVAELGLDPDRYSLTKHYTIPDHRVARGLPFDTSDAGSFEELEKWFANAALLLGTFGAPVRCWPHHFDIAALLGPIGIGMEPGDVYYDEPYWYVNKSPSPAAPPLHALAGGGTWHTHEWTGAVLPGSRLLDDGQEQQTAEFLSSAVDAFS